MTHRFEEPHPAFAGFSEFYAKEIVPGLAGLGAQQHSEDDKAWKTCAKVGLPGLALVVVSFFLDDARHLVAVIGIVLIGVSVWLGRRFFSRIENDSKTYFMEKICSFMGFRYQTECDPAVILPFSQLALIPDYDFANLEDEISGEHAGVAFKLFEANLTTMSRRKRNTRSLLTNNSRVFRGLLLQFTFPRPFSATTLVTQDKGWVGNLIEGQRFHIKRVELEDPAFEARFEVYSGDPAAARDLLTPSFMARLLALSERVGDNCLRLAFHEDALAISMHTARDQFELEGVETNLNDPRIAQRMLWDLSTPIHIIEALDLDKMTRA